MTTPMQRRVDWLRSIDVEVGPIVSVAANTMRRGASVHMGFQQATGGWRSLCGKEIDFAERSEADLSCVRCLSGMTLNNVAKDDIPVVATPTSVGSVVWLRGHPWVLDGGSERSRYTKRWVGVRRDGSIGSLSVQQMDRMRPAVVYEHED